MQTVTTLSRKWYVNVFSKVYICRMHNKLLSMNEGLSVPCCDAYGEGDGNIHIRDVTCTGSEENITSCSYFDNTLRTNHQLDVMVQCQQG